MSRMLNKDEERLSDEGMQGGLPPSANTRSRSEAGRVSGGSRRTPTSGASRTSASAGSAPRDLIRGAPRQRRSTRIESGFSTSSPNVGGRSPGPSKRADVGGDGIHTTIKGSHGMQPQQLFKRGEVKESSSPRFNEANVHSSPLHLSQSLPALTDSNDVSNIPTIKKEVPSDDYNFLATEETAPRDSCQYRGMFEPHINETVDDYVRHRNAVMLRKGNDLLLGTLGALNVNDEFAVSDLVDFTENIIASFGVTEVSYEVVGDDISIEADGVRKEKVSISKKELESDEVLIFNGCVAPYIEVPLIRDVFPIKVYESGHEEDVQSCQLCGNPGVFDEFEARQEPQLIRHQLHNGLIPKSPNEGEYFEDLFSVDLTLNGGNNRTYNFLPTASDLTEAVGYVINDDTSMKSRLGFTQILSLCFGDVRASSLRKLLVKYFIMKNCTYGIKGNSIRNVNFCG